MSKIILTAAGGLIFLIILIIAVSLIASISFNQKVTKAINKLFAENEVYEENIIGESDLEALPAVVRKWLEYSQVKGKEKIHTVRLKQKAELRLEQEQPWMSVEADQYFTTNQPGFIWKANIKAFPFFHISGRDKYYNGRGEMLIKPLSLFTIADSKGEEIDQGTLLRYL
ncbi:MAG TPA: DUF6544 family protein, partial [Halanaerobiales bacterium]|nr:DUF6544 family protein [Halanaerobiales bacterium]